MRHRDQILALLQTQIGNSEEVEDIRETAEEVADEWVDPVSGGKEETNGLIYGVFSINAWILRSFRPSAVERFHGVGAVIPLRITEHVQGDAVVDVLLGANAIDGFLHFAVATVAPFHGVGG